MKIKVFADKSGKIVGTFSPTKGKGGSPSSMRMSIAGSHEHEMEIADHLLKPGSIEKLHSEYRVDSTGHAPKLVKS